jgi:hypothetical protein
VVFVDDRHYCLDCFNFSKDNSCLQSNKKFIGWIQSNNLGVKHRCVNWKQKYQFQNLQSCAQAVKDMRPSKANQELMLKIIAEHQDAPSRADVIQAVKI